MTITEFLLARIAEDEAREARKFRHRDDLLWGCKVSTHIFDPQYVTITPPGGGSPVKMTAAEFRERYTEPAISRRRLRRPPGLPGRMATRLENNDCESYPLPVM